MTPQDEIELIEVRVLAPMWIGAELYAIGDRVRLHPHEAQALAASGGVEIIQNPTPRSVLSGLHALGGSSAPEG